MLVTITSNHCSKVLVNLVPQINTDDSLEGASSRGMGLSNLRYMQHIFACQHNLYNIKAEITERWSLLKILPVETLPNPLVHKSQVTANKPAVKQENLAKNNKQMKSATSVNEGQWQLANDRSQVTEFL